MIQDRVLGVPRLGHKIKGKGRGGDGRRGKRSRRRGGKEKQNLQPGGAGKNEKSHAPLDSQLTNLMQNHKRFHVQYLTFILVGLFVFISKLMSDSWVPG